MAVAAMGDPGVAARLINHVGNATTTLLQKSFPRRLCRLLRAAKGSANALWSALFALMATSPTSVRFSVVRSRRSPIVLPLMTMEVFFHIHAANETDIVSTSFSPVAAIIKVESGEVSKELLLAMLARIIPVP
jgi:hypothetical protein